MEAVKPFNVRIKKLILLLLYLVPGVNLWLLGKVHSLTLLDTKVVPDSSLFIWLLASGGLLFLLEHIRRKTIPEETSDSVPSPFSVHIIWILVLVPGLTLSWFWTREDFRSRLKWAMAIALITYIMWGWMPQIRFLLNRINNVVRPYKLGVYLFLVCSIMAVSPLSPSPYFTGDEPHYLIITQSLVRDHDLDVANNYLEGQYGLISGQRLGIHAWQGKGPDRHYYSIHMPLLSAILAPFYVLGERFPSLFSFTIRLGMLLIGVWSIMGFHQLVRSITPYGKDATLATLTFSMTVPILFYAYHLYPEIVVLGILTRAFCVWTFPRKHPLWILFYGFMVGLFPLWGTKYLAVLLAWIPLSVYRAVRERGNRRHLIYFTCFNAIGFMLFAIYLWMCYGHLNPMGIYSGGSQSSEAMANLLYLLSDPSLWNKRLSSWASYFIDQRDGLLFYSPIYFFGLLGWVHWYRRDTTKALYAMILFVAHVGLYGFSTIRGGYAPPARPLVPVLWVPALGWPAWWHSKHRAWVRTIASISVLYSLILPWYMATSPLSVYQSTNHDVLKRAGATFERLSNLYIYLPDYLPSYVKSQQGPWWPNYFWGLFFFFTVLLYLGRLAKSRQEAMMIPIPKRTLSPGIITPLVALGFTVMTSGFPRITPKAYAYTNLAALGTSVYYHPQACVANVTDKGVFIAQCKFRKELKFILESHNGTSHLDARIICTTKSRPLDSWLYWFDLRPKPVRMTVNEKDYYHYLWPFWTKYAGRRWGYLRLVPMDADYPKCKDFQLFLNLAP